ncbi:hypothetical protein EBB59_08020 [Lysobacter pythonis]|uniref:Uncharacterized protein n=1 Tax=Solilutibacter pythonis TaxID=2483112 RepID=A0A3M2I136_9GAMM|nr:hypothetical protein [Lysobacter pythonis]RMH92892.1 hypothetical protein EBB59_08020 [Lysobacter pythonis]
MRLAIGQLPALEQSHVQIAMRVISPRLPIPCQVVMEAAAELTLAPDPAGDALILSKGPDRLSLERPIRIVPLSDALSELINRSLAEHDAAPTASAGPGASTRPAAGKSLLAVLLEGALPGPSRVRLVNGEEFLIDARHHSAYHRLDPAGFIQRAQAAKVAEATPLDPAEFTRLTTREDAPQPIQVEQLCWAQHATPDAAALLERWHDDPQALVQLETWPNLSRQSDALAWLRVLARLSPRAMSLTALKQAAETEGISPARARFGLSLLFAFGHARIVMSPIEPIPIPAQPVTPPQPSPSLLGRLRARLRTLAN